MATMAGGAEATIARRRARGVSLAVVLAVAGGGIVIVGTWLPWMSYFAGIVQLRGLIGLNGRLLLVAGMLGVVSGSAASWSSEPRVRRIARRASGSIDRSIQPAKSSVVMEMPKAAGCLSFRGGSAGTRSMN